MQNIPPPTMGKLEIVGPTTIDMAKKLFGPDAAAVKNAPASPLSPKMEAAVRAKIETQFHGRFLAPPDVLAARAALEEKQGQAGPEEEKRLLPQKRAMEAHIEGFPSFEMLAFQLLDLFKEAGRETVVVRIDIGNKCPCSTDIKKQKGCDCKAALREIGDFVKRALREKGFETAVRTILATSARQVITIPLSGDKSP